MSVKHIKKYFNQIANQYSELLSELKDFEKEAEQGLIEPERLDLIKQNIQPLIDNYQRWSYMIFLLNMPNKKSKQLAYNKQHSKSLPQNSKNNLNSMLEENKTVLNNMKVYMDNNHD